MGRTCSSQRRKNSSQIVVEKLKGKNYMQGQRAFRRTILKSILKNRLRMN
jgi:hypothetical protein